MREARTARRGHRPEPARTQAGSGARTVGTEGHQSPPPQMTNAALAVLLQSPSEAGMRKTQGPVTPAKLLELQRSAGNQALVHLLHPSRPPSAAVSVPVQRGLVDDTLNIGGKLLSSLQSRAGGAVAAIKGGARSAWERVRALADPFIAGLRTKAASVWEAIQAGWGRLRRSVGAFGERIASFGRNLGQRLQQGLGSLVHGLRGGWAALKSRAASLWDALRTQASGLWTALKGKGRAFLGAHAADGCLSGADLADAHSQLSGEQSVLVGALTGEASALQSQTAGSAAGLHSQASSGMASIDNQARTGQAQVTATGTEAASAGSSEADNFRTEGQKGAAEVRGEAGQAAATVRGEAAVGEGHVRSETNSAAGGLEGMLGSLVGSLMGQAQGVIGSVRQAGTGSAQQVRQQSGNLLDRLQAAAGGALDRITSGLRTVTSQAATVLASLRRGLRRALDGVRGVWDRVKVTGRQVLDKLKSGWSWVRDQASGAWRAVRGKLTGLFGQGGGLLATAEMGNSCTLESVGQQVNTLAGTPVGKEPLSLAGDPVRLKTRSGADPPSLVKQGELSAMARRLGQGAALDSSVRRRMEPAFGTDFSHVRVHTDPPAATLADSLDARAVSAGPHVAFGPGEYRPGTLIGDALIAHELAHVAQHDGSKVAPSAPDHDPDSGAELDADRSAVRAVARAYLGQAVPTAAIEPALPRLRRSLALRRCAKKCCAEGEEVKDVEALPMGTETFTAMPAAAASLPDIKAKAGGRDLYGLTTFALLDTVSPLLGLKIEEGGCKDKCSAPFSGQPKFSLAEYLALPAGTYDNGPYEHKTALGPDDKCVGKKMPKKMVIDQKVAAKMAEAEVEHKNDYLLAYNSTVAKMGPARARLAQGLCYSTKMFGSCNDAVKHFLEKSTGFEYKKWPVKANCFFQATFLRDNKKWHTFRDGDARKEIAPDCSEVRFVLDDPAKTPNIGTMSSEDLIASEGCG